MLDESTALVIGRGHGEGIADRAWPNNKPAANCFYDLALFKHAGNIELRDANADIVDQRHIIVGNENGLPLSSSHDPNRADDNEFFLLEVEAMLRAR